MKRSYPNRNVVSVSLPHDLYEYLEMIVKEKPFASKSEFFRHLLSLYRQKKLRGQLDTSRKERAEEARLSIRRRFNDIKLLSELIAGTIEYDESSDLEEDP